MLINTGLSQILLWLAAPHGELIVGGHSVQAEVTDTLHKDFQYKHLIC